MQFLRFASRKTKSEIDPRVLTYLSKVPPCTGVVRLADETESGFLCTVTIDTSELRQWLAKSIKYDKKQSTQWRVGRAALDIWLSEARLDVAEPVGLPSFMALVIRPYLEPLIGCGACTLFCSKCDKGYRQADTVQVDELDDGGIPGGHSWRCPQGHLLFDDR